MSKLKLSARAIKTKTTRAQAHTKQSNRVGQLEAEVLFSLEMQNNRIVHMQFKQRLYMMNI